MSYVRSWFACALLLGVVSGCADQKPRFIDAGPLPTDAPSIDAPDVPIDAPIDAPPPPPLPAYEITGGARGLRGTTHTADIQIGHGIDQQPATGNGKTVQGNAAIKP